jgi:hypothetical protein
VFICWYAEGQFGINGSNEGCNTEQKQKAAWKEFTQNLAIITYTNSSVVIKVNQK